MDDRANIPATGLALFVLAISTLFFSPGAGAQDSVDSTRDVEVRMFLIDVENIDDVSQSFTANLTLVLRWRDPNLAHGGPQPISVPLDTIWFPNLQLLNQQKLVSPFPRLAVVHPGGEVVYRQR